MQRSAAASLALFLLFGALLAAWSILGAPPAESSIPAARALLFAPTAYYYLPAIYVATGAPPSAPPIIRNWDSRLDQRFAVLVPAQVVAGQGYWQLVSATWFDLYDPRPLGVGDHDIAVDVQNAQAERLVGMPVRVSWDSGRSLLYTQAKAGETYAGSSPMYELAPAYRAWVDDGAPSDAVDGLGLGTIAEPYYKVHTSYGLVWRWAIAGGPALPSATPTATPLATPGSGGYLFNRAWLASCAPQASGTWFSGMATLTGLPANGYRVVWSWCEGCAPVTGPAITGPHDGYSWPDGYYSHIVGVGAPRAGDWSVWIEDAAGTRISAIAFWHSTGSSDTSCNDATINFADN